MDNLEDSEFDFPDIGVIEAFLGDFPYEVGMRSHAEMTEEMRQQLESLAEGSLPEPQRDAFCRDVLQRSDAVDYLAELARRRQDEAS